MNEELVKELLNEIKELNKNINSINREVFDARGAAEYLSMGYGSLLRLARIRAIDYVSNGSSYLFKKEHLDEWLDKNVKVSQV